MLKKQKEELKFEVAGVALLAFAAIGLISLLMPSSVGVVGGFISKLLKFVAGEGCYLFPLLMSFLGIKLLKKEDRARLLINGYGAGLLLIVVLTFLHRSYPPSLSFKSGLEGEGGGVVGSVSNVFLHQSFGSVGMYIILFTITLVGLLFVTNLSTSAFFEEIIRRLQSNFKRIGEFLSNYLFVEVGEKIKVESPVIINQGSELVSLPASERQKPVENLKETEAVISSSRIHDEESSDEDLAKTGDLKINHSIQKPLARLQPYRLPSVTILSRPLKARNIRLSKDITDNIRILEETLESFGIKAKINQVSCGPAITRYEIQPPPGIKVSRIVNLADDIALSMAAPGVRIEAPIPGKAAVGIEVPNKEIFMVHLRELLESPEFVQSTSHLTVALGKDIAGSPIVADLSQMPHLLIAGATGSGKSVCLNTMITSILFKASPEEVKFLIIDPKMVELADYNGIPHLISPVVTSPQKAANVLRWAVKEMERRYILFASKGVRDIARYNSLHTLNEPEEDDKLPYIVIIIDELADLMMIAPADVEDAICRLAQMARAAGIHLVVATQRPSVDVITGLIKANIPSRLSFAVSSQTDSRTILDMNGAEKLLGKGDMLFFPVGAAKPVRIQGAYLSDRDVEELVNFLKRQAQPQYDEKILEEKTVGKEEKKEWEDELLPQAVKLLIEYGHASISMLQRRFHIGYSRAARLIDIMERRGIVGGFEGSKPRAILMTMEQFQQTFEGKG